MHVQLKKMIKEPLVWLGVFVLCVPLFGSGKLKSLKESLTFDSAPRETAQVLGTPVAGESTVDGSNMRAELPPVSGSQTQPLATNDHHMGHAATDDMTTKLPAVTGSQSKSFDDDDLEMESETDNRVAKLPSDSGSQSKFSETEDFEIGGLEPDDLDLDNSETDNAETEMEPVSLPNKDVAATKLPEDLGDPGSILDFEDSADFEETEDASFVEQPTETAANTIQDQEPLQGQEPNQEEDEDFDFLFGGEPGKTTLSPSNEEIANQKPQEYPQTGEPEYPQTTDPGFGSFEGLENYDGSQSKIAGQQPESFSLDPQIEATQLPSTGLLDAEVHLPPPQQQHAIAGPSTLTIPASPIPPRSVSVSHPPVSLPAVRTYHQAPTLVASGHVPHKRCGCKRCRLRHGRSLGSAAGWQHASVTPNVSSGVSKAGFILDDLLQSQASLANAQQRLRESHNDVDQALNKVKRATNHLLQSEQSQRVVQQVQVPATIQYQQAQFQPAQYEQVQTPQFQAQPTPYSAPHTQEAAALWNQPAATSQDDAISIWDQ